VEIRAFSEKVFGNREYAIADAERIHRLVVFANARRDASQPALSTMPASPLTANFYDGSDLVGTFGSGSNFFYVSCSNWKDTRMATPAELAEFQQLVAPAK
jgi:hypothetical protein